MKTINKKPSIECKNEYDCETCDPSTMKKCLEEETNSSNEGTKGCLRIILILIICIGLLVLMVIKCSGQDYKLMKEGMLIPRLTQDQIDTIQEPDESQLVYNLDEQCFNFYREGWKSICSTDEYGDCFATTNYIFGGNCTASGKYLVANGTADASTSHNPPKVENEFIVPYAGYIKCITWTIENPSASNPSQFIIYINDIPMDLLIGSYRGYKEIDWYVHNMTRLAIRYM